MSCGVGSQRKRVRHMVRLPSPAECNQISQYGLSASGSDALANGYGRRDKASHGAPWPWCITQSCWKSMTAWEGQHGQEVMVVFVAGSMSMLALLGMVARLSYGRFGSYESSQVRTSFLSRNSREELPQSDCEAPFMSQ